MTCDENMIVRIPTMTRITVTNRPKLSATMTPKLAVLRFHSNTDGHGRADQADDAEPADRHALALAAERFRTHGGQRRQRDAEHRDDGVKGGVEHVLLRLEC